MARKHRPAVLLLSALITVAAMASDRCHEPSGGAEPVRVLIVTGGHPFEPGEFFAMFKEMSGIRYESVLLADGKPLALSPGGLKTYDVVVFYDLERDAITAEWQDLVRRGRGLVFLHHALGSFPLSREVKSIMGGSANFFFGEYPNLPHSSVSPVTNQRLSIVDRVHPVTCGMEDFSLLDEPYDDLDVDSHVHVLVISDAPKRNTGVVWTWTYEQKRVLYIQPGHGSLGLPLDHGPTAYQNDAFRRLVERGILWSAGRL